MFFVSAVGHEVVVGVPLHMLRGWAFWGIMLQVRGRCQGTREWESESGLVCVLGSSSTCTCCCFPWLCVRLCHSVCVFLVHTSPKRCALYLFCAESNTVMH